MLTSYGKFIRKYRIDQGLTMAQMIGAIGVTKSYMSAVELGKRRMTPVLLDRITRYIMSRGGSEILLCELVKCAKDSIQIIVDGKGKDPFFIKIMTFFANYYDELEKEDLKQIGEIIKKYGG